MVAAEDELRRAGVDAVYVYCVNDAYVMSAWRERFKLKSKFVNFLADPGGELTRSLGLGIASTSVWCAFRTVRTKRSVVVVKCGVADAVALAETADDPIGQRPENFSHVLYENVILLL